MFSFEHVLVHLLKQKQIQTINNKILFFLQPAGNEVEIILPLSDVFLLRQWHDPGWSQQEFFDFFFVIFLFSTNESITKKKISEYWQGFLF